jgi:hypothetical protein
MNVSNNGNAKSSKTKPKYVSWLRQQPSRREEIVPEIVVHIFRDGHDMLLFK